MWAEGKEKEKMRERVSLREMKRKKGEKENQLTRCLMVYHFLEYLTIQLLIPFILAIRLF